VNEAGDAFHPWSGAGAIVFIAAAAATAALIALLHPVLRQYALARPNQRSSHKVPTPQGGGIAVVAVTTITVAVALYLLPLPAGDAHQLAWTFAATLMLAIVGAIDDVRALATAPRLVLQALAVVVVIAALPADLRVVPVLPWWAERALMLIGGVWFVNLVNFMDGIDWITVAEVVPVTGALALFGQLDALPPQPALVTLALCGAMIGFAPFNRPVARLFLGDVGSLPIGLLLGWLLLQLAGNGHLAAALLLPLYYLADTTITLVRRLIKGERITQAHRSHFYQRATDHGFSVNQIIGRVFAVNILLAMLATISLQGSAVAKWAPFLLGVILVGALLWTFGRRRR
jgi:UDP-N-acetylmuramyl pentapeptide phosphotransferase/UDP-N-acetylglucosamine-1-phosphate transferase